MHLSFGGYVVLVLILVVMVMACVLIILYEMAAFSYMLI